MGTVLIYGLGDRVKLLNCCNMIDGLGRVVGTYMGRSGNTIMVLENEIRHC